MEQQPTYTVRHNVHVMPWQIEPSEDLNRACILLAVMNGNEMQSVSLHVADPGTRDE